MPNDVYEWCDRCQCMTAQVVLFDNSSFCGCNVCGDINQVKDEYVECPDCECRCDGVEPYRDQRDDENYRTKKYQCPRCFIRFEVYEWD